MKKIKMHSSEQGYDAAADFYDEKEKYLNSFEHGNILPLLGDIKEKKILDVGAGTGRLSLLLARAGAHVTALDVSSRMLEMLKRKNKHIVTVVGDAENLPFADSSFDAVTAAFLIVHLKYPTRFFDEVYRVLKDGGVCVITNINQKDPPPVKIKNGQILIESYYHRPERIKAVFESLAFTVAEEIFIKENDVWINQIILAKK